MRLETEPKFDFCDVLIRPKRSRLASRSEIYLNRTLRCPHSGIAITGIPVVAANMDTIGTFKMADCLVREHSAFVALHKHYTVDQVNDYLGGATFKKGAVFVTSGTHSRDLEKLDKINKLQHICLDVANGYSERFLEAVSEVRDRFPDSFIMAGNVCTPEMTEALLLKGASCVKVGIGPGSSCTTRVMTGVGYPQLSALIECADAAHGLNGHICADGGCVVPGDLSKAFGAGADLVMMGGMLAGTDECEGEWICNSEGEREFLQFYGMSSAEAMKRHSGGVAAHRAAEGKKVRVPYKGSANTVMMQILGGVRSACTYVGAQRIKDLPKCTTFIRTATQENKVFGAESNWWRRT